MCNVYSLEDIASLYDKRPVEVLAQLYLQHHYFDSWDVHYAGAVYELTYEIGEPTNRDRIDYLFDFEPPKDDKGVDAMCSLLSDIAFLFNDLFKFEKVSD